MHRALFAATSLALCATAAAQEQLDPSRLRPATAIQRHGVYDLASGTWQAPAPESSGLVVFDNTCLPGIGSFYIQLQDCEDLYDEGRIPSTGDPMAPSKATDDNRIRLFELSYCTDAPTGTVDVKVAFWDNIGASCFGGIPPTPPPIPSTATAYFDLGAAAGYPLPGSSIPGRVECHTVALAVPAPGFCLKSDGDGIYDADPDLDLFTWSFQHENAGSQTGPILAGDPMLSAPGSCTYDLPCGAGCGSGLGAEDRFWVNLDGDAPNGTNSGNCPNGLFAGTACYFFGGYPASPFASFHMRMESAGPCAGCTGNASVYCTAKVNSAGCTPSIGVAGLPSGSAASGFVVNVQNVIPNQPGILFYSRSGAVSAPFFGGTLCVERPLFRTPVMTSGGGMGPCDGTFAIDFNAFIASGKDPGLVGGRDVWLQAWSKDPGFSPPNDVSLSDAVQFTICP
jgi:hypothetical protein